MLRIDGEVKSPGNFTARDFEQVDPAACVADVSEIDPKREGRAVRLSGLLQKVGVKPSAQWLTLHASRDDFHASIPLAAVKQRALIIYEVDGQPLPESAGGPYRFLIPDFAACHTADIDECANVKYVDRIELTAERGFDNRPTNDADHAQRHAT